MTTLDRTGLPQKMPIELAAGVGQRHSLGSPEHPHHRQQNQGGAVRGPPDTHTSAPPPSRRRARSMLVDLRHREGSVCEAHLFCASAGEGCRSEARAMRKTRPVSQCDRPSGQLALPFAPTGRRQARALCSSVGTITPGSFHVSIFGPGRSSHQCGDLPLNVGGKQTFA